MSNSLWFQLLSSEDSLLFSLHTFGVWERPFTLVSNIFCDRENNVLIESINGKLEGHSEERILLPQPNSPLFSTLIDKTHEYAWIYPSGSEHWSLINEWKCQEMPCLGMVKTVRKEILDPSVYPHQKCVYSGLRPIRRSSFVEIRSADCVQSWWQTNKQKNRLWVNLLDWGNNHLALLTFRLKLFCVDSNLCSVVSCGVVVYDTERCFSSFSFTEEQPAGSHCRRRQCVATVSQ